MKLSCSDYLSVLSPAIAYALLILFAIVSVALSASDAPRPRLARSLPEDRVEACRIRELHNQALLDLFALYGIPSGSDASNIVARTRALELLAAAATNSAGKAKIGAVLKDLRTRNPGVFTSDK